MRTNLVLEKSVDFAVEIVKFCDALKQLQMNVIAHQLLKSGTAIGANIFEAQHAESRADFVHKMKLAAKEANETFYWLTIITRVNGQCDEISSLQIRVVELLKLLSKIIVSARRGNRI